MSEFVNNEKVTSFHGIMSSDRNLFVGTGTPGPGTNAIVIGRKRAAGVAYDPSDLNNKHFGYHQMETAFGGCDGWEYGAGTIDSGGAVRATSFGDLCGPGTVNPDEVLGTLTIDSDGFVTGGGDFAGFTGFMSPDKTTIFRVATDVEDGGTPNHLLTTFSLKDPGKVFAQPDLAGIYRGHTIQEGPSRWAYGSAAIGTDGVASLSGTEPEGSWSGIVDTFLLEPDGTIRNDDEPTFHGTLSPNNNVWIVTGTDHYGHGELDFTILVK